MITPLWKIETLWVKPVEGSLTDVVVTAAWRCSATDGQYSGSVYATVSFSPPDPATFIDFSKLTQEEVLNWVWTNGVDKNAAEEAVVQQIEQQRNPPIITPPLPWPTGGIDASTLTAPPKPVVVEPPAPIIEAPVE